MESFTDTVKKIGRLKSYFDKKKRISEEKFFIVFKSEKKSMFPKSVFDRIREGDTIKFEGTDGGEWINIDTLNFQFELKGNIATTPTTPTEVKEREIEVEVNYITKPKKNKANRYFVMARNLKDQPADNVYINLSAISEEIREEVLQGYGTIRIKGTEGHDMFFANEVLFFEPTIKEEVVEVELKDINFSLYYISFTVGDKQITLPTDDLPFDTSPVFEKIKSEFKGSIKVTGSFRKSGLMKKNKETKEWTETIQWQEDGEIKVDYSKVDTDSIKKIEDKYQKDLEYTKLMAILRSNRMYRSFTGIKKMFSDRGLKISTKEIEGLYWDEKYDKEFYNTLKDKADEIYVSDEEFVFTMKLEGDREFRIVERPIVNSATYIFGDKCSMEELLFKLKETRKTDIIQDAQYQGQRVQELLGYKGRVVHQDYSEWLKKIETIIGDGVAIELEDKFIW